MIKSIEHRITALEQQQNMLSQKTDMRDPKNWPRSLPGEGPQAHILRVLRGGVTLEQLVAASNSLPAEETYP